MMLHRMSQLLIVSFITSAMIWPTTVAATIHPSAQIADLRRCGKRERNKFVNSLLPKTNTWYKSRFAEKNWNDSKNVSLATSNFKSSSDCIDVYRGGGAVRGNGYIGSLPFASTMAFLAGCSDVLCIRRFQCYTAMMTGNVVSMSMSLADKKWTEATRRLSLIGCYFVGAIIVRSTESVCKEPIKKNSSTMSASQGSDFRSRKIICSIVVAIFAIADRMVWINLLALGYGIVYASANLLLNGTITQLLTGHVTKLGIAVSDRLLGADKDWNHGTSTTFCIIVSFVSGGLLGTVLSHLKQERPIFAMIGVIYALLLALC